MYVDYQLIVHAVCNACFLNVGRRIAFGVKDLQINIPLPIILCKFLIALRYADSGVALLLGGGGGGAN